VTLLAIGAQVVGKPYKRLYPKFKTLIKEQKKGKNRVIWHNTIFDNNNNF